MAPNLHHFNRVCQSPGEAQAEQLRAPGSLLGAVLYYTALVMKLNLASLALNVRTLYTAPAAPVVRRIRIDVGCTLDKHAGIISLKGDTP